ncbi:MAG: beta-propeller fold lactonase family protein [Lacisediminihabitans sp.]
MTQDSRVFWAGSYTASMDGTSRGIGALRARNDGSLEYLGLAATTSCPSFLAAGIVPGIVYATDEAQARVEAFRREGDTLVSLGGQPTSGKLPCHISATAQWLYVANYFNGTVDAFPLSEDGTVGPLRASLSGAGSGPHPNQDGPHAHSTLVVGESVFSADLGTDQVHVQRWLDGRLERVSSTPFPPGTGPRDFVMTMDGRIFLVGELSGEVFELGKDAQILRSSPSVVDSVDGDHWAGLVMSDSGKFLYTGMRGSNRIAIVDALTLSPIAAISCGGDWPRNLWLSSEILYVANERSSTVTSFRIDHQTGIPILIGSPEAVPTPTYILPAG